MTAAPGDVLVIVPTYNERENVTAIIDAVQQASARTHVLIVDDNSPDRTGDIVAGIAASNGRVHLLRRAGKLGLGTAYRDGFRWALQRSYEYVMEMDADFSHDPKDIPRFIEAAQDADFVIGSRYLDGNVTVTDWPMSRLMLSYFANVYARTVTGLRIWDLTAGYKCFHRRVLEAIDLGDVRSNGYGFQIEMNFRAFRKGFRWKEIGIVFSDRTHGTSKMHGGIVREALLMVWRLRWWAITGRV
ncbi:MAG: polyprenol monophosphomannose synthase [Gemmatimonadetes bacterium]|nr:polyprenol monophosphomannose synthase [Gemmatimonadota bacterium]